VLVLLWLAYWVYLYIDLFQCPYNFLIYLQCLSIYQPIYLPRSCYDFSMHVNKLHCIKRWNKTVRNKNEIREICVWNILLLFSYFKIKLCGISTPLIQLGLGKCKFCASQAAFCFYTFVCTNVSDFSPTKIRKYVKIT
jgi:hypothetical protein